ncbi:MAG: flagellar basal body-associated FliL family protein, partial [Arcobacter sp.]|nr:flagellar basal body-associated FliL family protein [Arcobacter sp.]
PMMIILIVLIVVLMGAVGGIGFLLYSKGVFEDKKEGAAPTEHVAKEAPAEDHGNVFFESEIKELVLNVMNSKGKAQLMKLSFSIKSTEPTIEALVTASKAEIIDVVINQISSRNSEELLTSAGKNLLKEELLAEVNTIINEAIASKPELHKNNVKELYFTTFVIK